MSQAFDVLRTTAAQGLPGAGRATREAERQQLSAEVISLAQQHKVQGLLWAAIEDGVFVGDDEQIERASESTVNALRTCVLSEETAALALTALKTFGVEARVLKGIVIAHLDHANPAERVYGDADILIRRADYQTALRALTDIGFRRANPPVRGWWEQRFAKAVVLLAPSGGELDLHLAITGGYFGERIDHDLLWNTASEPFYLAGTEARGLDREGRLLHACCHCVLGGGSGLRVRRDVAQLVLITGADWQSLVGQSKHAGTELVLAEAARTTWRDLRLDPRHGFIRWAEDVEIDPAQRHALARYTSGASAGWGPEGHSTLAAITPVDRIRFLAGLALPSRASLRHRGRTWRGHMSSGLRTLYRTRRPE